MTQKAPATPTPTPDAANDPSKDKMQKRGKADPEEAKRVEMMHKVSSYIATPKQNFVWQICMTQGNIILLTSTPALTLASGAIFTWGKPTSCLGRHIRDKVLCV